VFLDAERMLSTRRGKKRKRKRGKRRPSTSVVPAAFWCASSAEGEKGEEKKRKEEGKEWKREGQAVRSRPRSSAPPGERKRKKGRGGRE